LLDRDGKLTDHGKAIRADVENRTDAHALSAYDSLDDEQLQQLIEALVHSPSRHRHGTSLRVSPIGERFEV